LSRENLERHVLEYTMFFYYNLISPLGASSKGLFLRAVLSFTIVFSYCKSSFLTPKYPLSLKGRNQFFISGGGNIHASSFNDVIVVIQPWYNIFTNGHRYVLFAIFPKMITY